MQDNAGERIAISDLSCQNEPNFNFYKNESTRMYEVRFNVSEGSEKKLIHLELDNEVEPELSYTEGDQRVYVGTLPVATSMQATIAGIEKALRVWYHKDSELPKKVFDIAFEDFAEKIIEKYSSPERTPYLVGTKTKVLLLPSEASRLNGKVKFLELGREAFRIDFLNCSDQACLDSSDIRYSLDEDKLMIFNAKAVGDYWNVITQTIHLKAE